VATLYGKCPQRLAVCSLAVCCSRRRHSSIPKRAYARYHERTRAAILTRVVGQGHQRRPTHKQKPPPIGEKTRQKKRQKKKPKSSTPPPPPPRKGNSSILLISGKVLSLRGAAGKSVYQSIGCEDDRYVLRGGGTIIETRAVISVETHALHAEKAPDGRIYLLELVGKSETFDHECSRPGTGEKAYAVA